jgi:tetratricopeptide (TPR) repeat protein
MKAAEILRMAQAAMQAWATGDAARAEAIAREIFLVAPNEPNARQVLGLASLRAGRAAEAVAHLRAADAAAPNQAPILNSLGVALRQTGDLDGARHAYARAGALGLADAWRNLGGLERGENRIDAAMAAFEKALALQPSASAHANLAQLHEMRHQLDRAREHADAAVRLDPKNEMAKLALGQVLLRERDWSGVEALLAALAKDVNATPTNRAIAIGMIGEALDRMGRADEAFAAFTASNTLLRQLHAGALHATGSPFHPDTVQRLIRFLEQEDASAWSYPIALAQPAPVFLVGFPRSGTTLLDQILSSHPSIVCLEEKEILAPIVADLLDEKRLRAWAALPDAAIHELRRRYWESAMAALASPLDERVLVDKLPLNLVLLPAIARIFPDAKVIIALRDPRDAVLSAHQQRFGMNPAMAQLLELESAARYYDAAMTLLERCREKLTLRLHQVRYEDVVADLETAARGLAAFVDAPFEPAMLDFGATARRRDIATPSARQVIQPLYSRSVGRWRAYAAHLAPVLPILAPWAARFGYPP